MYVVHFFVHFGIGEDLWSRRVLGLVDRSPGMLKQKGILGRNTTWTRLVPALCGGTRCVQGLGFLLAPKLGPQKACVCTFLVAAQAVHFKDIWCQVCAPWQL